MEQADISVIIPVGPGHEHLAQKAIHSALMQHGLNYEIIVVKDTPSALAVPDGVTLIEGRQAGPSAARNDGVVVSSGEALVFLDADDMLCPGALKALWAAYKELGQIIYGSVIRSDNLEIHYSPEQYCGDDIKKSSLYVPKRMPTHLVPRTAFYAVGGWNEEAPLWEDVIFEIDLDIAGYCATRIDYPVYFYNFESGTRRVSELADEAKQYIKIKYDDYFKRKKIMGCGSCGNSRPVPRHTPTVRDNNMLSLFNTKILELEYIGGDNSVRTYIGPVTGRHYRFGATKAERTRKVRIGFGENEVHPDDAQQMARLADRNRGTQFKINQIGDKQPAQPKERTPRKGVEQKLKIEMGSEEVSAMKNAIWAGMSIEKFTIAELREAIDSVPHATLTRWLEEENAAEKPRVTVISMLETKIGVEDA